MARKRVLIDCYTDEPAGLGVPPFLGTWPRYAAGRYRDRPDYITIDDLRASKLKRPLKKRYLHPDSGRSRIDLLNTVKPPEETRRLLSEAKQLIVIAGVQTPGKYLSARPGTPEEACELLKPYKGTRILSGPAAEFGSQRFGGQNAEIVKKGDFQEIRPGDFSYEQISEYAVKGAALLGDIPHKRVLEIETGRGCDRNPGCSFCTEPLKNSLLWREPHDIIREVKKLYKYGARWFRLGKQNCIFGYQNNNLEKLSSLLSGISALTPEVFHVDNATPSNVTSKKIKLFQKYLTPGSTAALGVESFDPKVAEANNLNTSFDEVYETIKLFNKYSAERGENGLPFFLPGINIILGLTGETEKTLEKNFNALKKILENGFMLRRINIRKAVPYPGTDFHKTTGLSQLKKNSRFYKSFIKKVRREIDRPMLKRVFPEGTVLKNCISEVSEGNVSFLRQPGSYPVTVGVRKRLETGRIYNISVTEHGMRSISGKVIN